MTTLYYHVISKLDGEHTVEAKHDKFEHAYIAEDVMNSMEHGVFDDDFVEYVVDRIVYDLEGA